jgi:hypothetical protein
MTLAKESLRARSAARRFSLRPRRLGGEMNPAPTCTAQLHTSTRFFTKFFPQIFNSVYAAIAPHLMRKPKEEAIEIG